MISGTFFFSLGQTKGELVRSTSGLIAYEFEINYTL